MDTLLADLNIMYINLHTLHYNVVGQDFYQTHIFLEKEYDLFHQWIDVVAERIKIKGQYPKSSLLDINTNKTISDVASKDYTSKEAYTILSKDYQLLLKQIQNLKKQTDVITTNSLEDIEQELELKLWFIRCTLK